MFQLQNVTICVTFCNQNIKNECWGVETMLRVEISFTVNCIESYSFFFLPPSKMWSGETESNRHSRKATGLQPASLATCLVSPEIFGYNIIFYTFPTSMLVNESLKLSTTLAHMIVVHPLIFVHYFYPLFSIVKHAKPLY